VTAARAVLHLLSSLRQRVAAFDAKDDLIDFRGPDIGNFVFHCHILNHEDAGVINIIEVRPATGQVDNAATRKSGLDSAMELSRK
jgi:hypothetical protein